MMSNALTLSDILARGIAVQWHEAVASVRAVSEVLLGHPEDGRLLPELHQIQISADGRVSVIGGTAVQEPVRRLGQLLQATLGQSEPPVQLRLLISQATAPVPAFASISQYDDALGYFERPGRAAVLQALYLRASQAAAVTRVETIPSLDAIAPLPTSHPAKDANVNAGENTAARNVRLVSAGTVLVLLCGTAVGYRGAGETVAETWHQASASATHGLHRAGMASVRGFSWVTERVGLGRLVARDAVTAEDPAMVSAPKPLKGERGRPVPAKAASAETAQSVSSYRTDSAHEITGVDTAGAAVVAPRAALSARIAPFDAFDLEPAVDSTLSRHDVRGENQVVSNEPLRQSDEPTDDAAIYSQRSEGVSSPIAVRPQLPRELPPNVKRSDVRVIELVISALGTVESVRLVGVPRDVHDSMLLSAAKAWVFRPAEKDGVPVRFRKIIAVAPRS